MVGSARIRYIREIVENNLTNAIQFGNLSDIEPKPFTGLRILDIGCGGGLLSESLARLGGDVTGADAAVENVRMAQYHAAKDPSLKSSPLKYRHITAEQLCADGEQFDVVIASEVIEHVADQPGFVRSCASLLKDDGLLFFSTINRTIISNLLTIKAAEDILGIVPKGTHTHDQYVVPEELESWITENGCQVLDTSGVGLNPLIERWSLISRYPDGVRQSGVRSQFSLGLQMNYIMSAKKLGTRDLLIALDDSELSEHTLFWTFENLLDDGDRATVVTVPRAVNPLEVAGQGIDVKAHWNTEEEDMALAGIQSLVRSVKTHSMKNVEVAVKVQSGEPRQVISNMIKTLKPTMLVIGSRGTLNIPGILVGSVSSYLAMHSEVPVVVVRPPLLNEET
ncbi:Hexaprenyldihydroxybenzoate methyltransferase, mitochondrial [Nowakowskiella sp. JEL0407]|nr:Hexaprenyldihydroxybenzoate methyltransferase, mitochondrial [Nowakowskiella sp. JEL0407]